MRRKVCFWNGLTMLLVSFIMSGDVVMALKNVRGSVADIACRTHEASDKAIPDERLKEYVG